MCFKEISNLSNWFLVIFKSIIDKMLNDYNQTSNSWECSIKIAAKELLFSEEKTTSLAWKCDQNWLMTKQENSKHKSLKHKK